MSCVSNTVSASAGSAGVCTRWQESLVTSVVGSSYGRVRLQARGMVRTACSANIGLETEALSVRMFLYPLTTKFFRLWSIVTTLNIFHGTLYGVVPTFDSRWLLLALCKTGVDCAVQGWAFRCSCFEAEAYRHLRTLQTTPPCHFARNNNHVCVHDCGFGEKLALNLGDFPSAQRSTLLAHSVV